jgi:hypothetical protein
LTSNNGLGRRPPVMDFGSTKLGEKIGRTVRRCPTDARLAR